MSKLHRDLKPTIFPSMIKFADKFMNVILEATNHVLGRGSCTINSEQDSSSSGTRWVWSIHDLRVGHLTICRRVLWNNFPDVLFELTQRAWRTAAVRNGAFLALIQQSHDVVRGCTIGELE